MIESCHLEICFTRQKDELFQTISLTLSGSPAWRTQGLVRLSCCGQDTGLSLRYANESAVALTWVELRKLQPVDWSSITSKYNNTETGISYIELSWAELYPLVILGSLSNDA